MTKDKHSLFVPRFDDVEKDIDRYVKLIGKPDTIGTKKNPIPVIRVDLDAAYQHIVRIYLKDDRYSQVVQWLIPRFNWEVGDKTIRKNFVSDKILLEVTEALSKQKQITLIKRLWLGIIGKQKNAYWELFTYRKKIKPGYFEEHGPTKKALALETMNQLRDILSQLRDEEGVARISEDIDLFEQGKRRLVKSKPISQEIDDKLFWQIIAKAQSSSDSTSERIESIVIQLEAFSASQIRKFQKILLSKISELYRSDIWALAFIAQDGCSDDAFEAFRAWLVLQGQKIFNQAIQDIYKIVPYVPPGLGTSAPELFSAAEIAYEARAGKMMTPVKMPRTKLIGDHWEESDLERLYPKIVSHYRS